MKLHFTKYLLLLLGLVCINFSFAQTAINWAISDDGTGTADERINDVFVDKDGNVYACGYYDGSLTLGSTTLSSGAGGDEAFVVKTDPDGNVLWAKTSVGTSEAYASSIFVDEGGSVYVGGYYTHATMSWGALSILTVNGDDFYLVKFDSNGNPLHMTGAIISSTADAHVNSITGDADANIYLTGYVQSGNLNLPGGINLTTSYGNDDIFTAKTDSAFGGFIWANRHGNNKDDVGLDIEVLDDKVIIAGSYGNDGICTFYNGGSDYVLTNHGETSSWIASMNQSDGAVNWANTIGNGSNDSNIKDITVKNTNIYSTGDFKGDISFGVAPSLGMYSFTDTLTSAGDFDIFVAKHDQNGNFVSAIREGNTGPDQGTGITSDSTCPNLFTTGTFENTVTWSNGDALTAQNKDIFVGNYDTDLNLIWVKRDSSDNDVFAQAIHKRDTTLAYGGYFNSGDLTVATEPPTTLTIGSNDDIFLVSLNDADDPGYTFASTSFCQGDANPIPTITGNSGGTFSSTAGLSFVSSTTGEIDLAGSTPGSYDITYTLFGCDILDSVINITITAEDNPAFSYSAAAFCQGDTDPDATITGTGGGTFSSTAGLSIMAGVPGTIDLGLSTPGATYTVTYLTPGTCPNSSTFDVTINAEDDPSFSYSAAYCQGDTDPNAVITGTGGGTFSSTAGLSIIAGVPGTIDLGASTAGATYTVTYLTPGTCPNSTTFDVTINAEDDPAFSYSAAAFCQGDTDPNATITGTGGGTFSSTAGLSIMAGVPGTIDLGASTAGPTYTITYLTPGPDCPNSSTFDVTINAEDDPSFSYSAAAYCQGDTDPDAVITGTGGGTFSAGGGLSIIPGVPGTIDLSASTAGLTYTVTYLTPGVCPNSSTFDVTVNAEDNPAFSYSAAAFCQDDTDPNATITGTGGGTFSSTAGLSILASAPGTIDLSASTAGPTYTITYLTPGPDCPNSSTFDVTINAEDDPAFSYSAAAYCQDDTDPNAVITGTGGGTFSSTAGLSILAGVPGTIDLDASTAGLTYTVTYLTPGVCPNSSTFDVTINAEDDASFSYAASAFCKDDVNPAPTVTGTPGGTFTSTAGMLIDPPTGTISLIGSSTSVLFTVTYTTPGPECPNFETFDVIINPEDNPAFSYPASAYCQDETDPVPTITGTTGGTFTSTAGLSIPDPLTGEIDLSASTSGVTYTVTYNTPGPDCPNSETFDITINAEDDPTFSYSAPTFCQGDTDPIPTISGTGGGTFSSTAGLDILDPLTGEIDLSTSTDGVTYTVTYLSPGPDCPNSATFDVLINPEDDPSFSYSASAYCADDSDPDAIVTGTTGGSFSSTVGLSLLAAEPGTIDLDASTAGITYTITYLTAGVCPNSTTFDVTVNAEDDPSFSYSASSYCSNIDDPLPTITGTPGGFFTGTGGIALLSTSTGEINLDVSTPGGPYSIGYTTPGPDCPNSSSVLVSIIEADDPDFEYAPVTYCIGGMNPVATISGLPGGNFTELSSTLSFVDPGTGEINAGLATDGLYSIQYITNGTCPDTNDFVIEFLSVIDPVFSLVDTVCLPSGSIDLTLGTIIAPGETQSYYSYGPSGPASLSGAASTNLLPNPTGPGTYFITHVVENGACTDSSTHEIVLLPDYKSNYSNPDTLCEAEGNAFNLNTLFNGATNTGGEWQGFNVYNDSLWDITGLFGDYDIMYFVGEGICTDTTTNIIFVQADVDSSWLPAVTLLCNTSDTLLLEPFITGTAGGVFSGNGVLANEFIAESAGIGIHEITYTVGVSPCRESLMHTIEVVGIENLDAGDQKFVCGLVIEMTGLNDAGATNLWTSSSDLTIENPDSLTATFTANGFVEEYVYLTSSLLGVCTSMDSVLLKFYPEPVANAGPDQLLEFEFETNLAAEPAYGGDGIWTTNDDVYIWNETDSLTSVGDLNQGTNTFYWTVSNNACPDAVDSMKIVVNNLFIPEAVTPNGDNQNDFFVVNGIHNFEHSVVIMNRWGQEVYSSTAYENDWNGVDMNGEELVNDTYFYIIKMGEDIEKQGFIVLKR